MKINKIGFFTFFFLIAASLFNSEYWIVKLLNFFVLPLGAYYFGVRTKENKDDNLLLISLFIIFEIISYYLNPSDFNILIPANNALKLLLCFIVWKNIAKYLDKIIYIPITGILSLIIGFTSINNVLGINYIIGLLPFFLIGYLINFETKLNKIIKLIIGLLLFCLVIAACYYIMNNYYISNGILLLEQYAVKKYVVFRAGYFFIALLMIISINFICNGLKTFFKNDSYLLAYLLTPVLSIIINKFYELNYYHDYYILVVFIVSGLYLLLFSNGLLKKLYIKLINLKYTRKIFKPVLLIFTCLMIGLNTIKVNVTTYPIYSSLTSEEKNQFNNDIRLSFIGDLIMLEDQVKAGFDGENYNYDKMFEYVSKYFEESDYTIGVLEGPVADMDYTIGNYSDGKTLHLNYPTEFIDSIKNAGIDLVTISNNHLLDKGEEGLKQTVQNLKDKGMNFVGYEDDYFIFEVQGVTFGVLAYTCEANFYSEDELIDLGVTRVIVDPSSKYFNEIKNDVVNDINELKEKVDMVIVMPHMGEQFLHETNFYQDTWNNIFINAGADIVLGDHPHAVEPIEYIGNGIVVNCPGNFANSYTDYDGDATAIVEIYVDPVNKVVDGSSIVPMYTIGDASGFYYNLAIYDVMNDDELYNSLSKLELERIKEVHSVITQTMLNEDIDIDDIEYRYYLTRDGYKRSNVEPLDLSSYENNELLNLIGNASSITFIGDSVTEGTRNGGYGWFEPIMANYDKEYINLGYGGYTTGMYLAYKTDILNKDSSDLNIIALGTNDIRYQDSTSAITTDEYLNNLTSIVNIIKENNPNSKFVFIAPWYSLDYDSICVLSLEDKKEQFKLYSNALKQYCEDNGYLFIDANNYIEEFLKNKIDLMYMKDFIHPNKTKGIYLYSEAVLDSINN